MTDTTQDTNDVIAWLRRPSTIRSQSKRLYELALNGQLTHFELDLTPFNKAVTLVSEVTRSSYPKLDVPYHSRWRHFCIDGLDRVKLWQDTCPEHSPTERVKSLFELVITSVLLDAGAGDQWRFHDKKTGQTLVRSEGLAIASLELYLDGHLSSDPNKPWRVDGERLMQITPDSLGQAFQVSQDNPLAGLAGRANLLNQLGKAITTAPQNFGGETRLGGFFSNVYERQQANSVNVSDVFLEVLTSLGSIWPSRSTWAGISLGDVWPHSALTEDRPGANLVPFHKLSQWLTYSLIEPLEQFGLRLSGVDELTGLPEYRNGGLFLDIGVLRPRYDSLLSEPQDPTSEAIVEWRGLTVALLDELASKMREDLGLDERSLPLAKVLQGGSWAAGRLIASKKRKGGVPPIQIISDGTIF